MHDRHLLGMDQQLSTKSKTPAPEGVGAEAFQVIDGSIDPGYRRLHAGEAGNQNQLRAENGSEQRLGLSNLA